MTFGLVLRRELWYFYLGFFYQICVLLKPFWPWAPRAGSCHGAWVPGTLYFKSEFWSSSAWLSKATLRSGLGPPAKYGQLWTLKPQVRLTRWLNKDVWLRAGGMWGHAGVQDRGMGKFTDLHGHSKGLAQRKLVLSPVQTLGVHPSKPRSHSLVRASLPRSHSLRVLRMIFFPPFNLGGKKKVILQWMSTG